MSEQWIKNIIGRGYDLQSGDGFLVKLEELLSILKNPTDDPDFLSPDQKKHLARIEEAASALQGAIYLAFENGIHDEREAAEAKGGTE